jgi:ankyrin repeat protein
MIAVNVVHFRYKCSTPLSIDITPPKHNVKQSVCIHRPLYSLKGVELKNSAGWIHCCFLPLQPCISTLLAAGARPEVINSLGATALMCAAQAGYASIVSMLLVAGANAGTVYIVLPMVPNSRPSILPQTVAKNPLSPRF